MSSFGDGATDQVKRFREAILTLQEETAVEKARNAALKKEANLQAAELDKHRRVVSELRDSLLQAADVSAEEALKNKRLQASVDDLRRVLSRTENENASIEKAAAAAHAHKTTRFGSLLGVLAESYPEACELFKVELLEGREQRTTVPEAPDYSAPTTVEEGVTPEEAEAALVAAEYSDFSSSLDRMLKELTASLWVVANELKARYTEENAPEIIFGPDSLWGKECVPIMDELIDLLEALPANGENENAPLSAEAPTA
ncbi:hypothetical protein T484DRAFT_1808200 [Baffinella frigidus]|nr:hypothetical protein T484DRAFT_1808200 [Cryptophyta sp. CCMP2293]